MLLLAATAMEKLEQVPKTFWVNALMALAAFVVGVLLVRHAAGMNKLVLALIVFLFVTVVAFQWVFERNEPRFLTPYVDKIAPFFPSKIEYGERQQGTPANSP